MTVSSVDVAFAIYLGVALVISFFGSTGYDLAIGMLALAGASMIFNLVPK